ncbi:MAG TPA: NAD-dependent epimerase/dehydratase family protein [Chitinophagales bacterium]|nr:NAD-dependent epimerase/dehydratase family protein [Chitinophagales bacterium]
MTTLVTGGNGFIGSHLVKQLLGNGHTVKAMALQGTSLQNLEGLNCEVVYADITKPETLNGILNNVEVVYHLAALPSVGWGRKIFEVNYYGTENLLKEAVKSGVRRFVFMSSLVVHGFKNFNGADENEPVLKPGLLTRPYVESKIKCEELVNSYKGRVEVVIIRPGFNIYGPNDMLASREILSRMAAGKTMAYINGGKSKLGYVYVENLAHGLVCAGTSANAAGNTYIIADYEPPVAPVKELFGQFAEKLGVQPKIYSLPGGLLFVIAAIVDAFYFVFMRGKMPLFSTYIVNTSTTNLYFTPDKARREIGFTQVVPFNEGVARTVAWYKSLAAKNN